MTSDCPAAVGNPVDGDPRCMSTSTQGISIMTAKPRFSSIRLNPGPDVAVIERAPAADAPMTEAKLLSSSSIWIKTPPTSGNLRASLSATSVEGVIGYPPKKLHPAAIAPSAQASSPCMKCLPVRTDRPFNGRPLQCKSQIQGRPTSRIGSECRTHSLIEQLPANDNLWRWLVSIRLEPLTGKIQCRSRSPCTCSE